MTLDADEFIRRLLLHVLPNGFHRIRHYGYLANGHLPQTSRSAGDYSQLLLPRKIEWLGIASYATSS